MSMLRIEEAVTAILLGLNPPIPVLDRDTTQDPPKDARGRVVQHIRFQVVVAPSSAFALAKGGTILRRGFVQVDLYGPESAGRPELRQAGERIMGAFPRLTQLGLARVERPAYAAEPLKETPYYHVPVTIPWDARVREGA